MLENAMRELRADRFRRSGGRRRDDLPAEILNHQPPPSNADLTMKLLIAGAAGFLGGSLFGGALSYLLFG